MIMCFDVFGDVRASYASYSECDESFTSTVN